MNDIGNISKITAPSTGKGKENPTSGKVFNTLNLSEEKEKTDFDPSILETAYHIHKLFDHGNNPKNKIHYAYMGSVAHAIHTGNYSALIGDIDIHVARSDIKKVLKNIINRNSIDGMKDTKNNDKFIFTFSEIGGRDIYIPPNKSYEEVMLHLDALVNIGQLNYKEFKISFTFSPEVGEKVEGEIFFNHEYDGGAVISKTEKTEYDIGHSFNKDVMVIKKSRKDKIFDMPILDPEVNSKLYTLCFVNELGDLMSHTGNHKSHKATSRIDKINYDGNTSSIPLLIQQINNVYFEYNNIRENNKDKRSQLRDYLTKELKVKEKDIYKVEEEMSFILEKFIKNKDFVLQKLEEIQDLSLDDLKKNIERGNIVNKSGI